MARHLHGRQPQAQLAALYYTTLLLAYSTTCTTSKLSACWHVLDIFNQHMQEAQKQKKAGDKASDRKQADEASPHNKDASQVVKGAAPKDPDPQGKALATTQDPLGEASKLVGTLREHAGDRLQTHLWAFKVCALLVAATFSATRSQIGLSQAPAPAQTAHGPPTHRVLHPEPLPLLLEICL